MQLVNAPLWMIPAFPLLGAVIAYLAGRSQKDAAGWVATVAAAGSFLVTVQQFLKLTPDTVMVNNLFTWFAAPGLDVSFSFRFDQLTAVMCLVVTGIGTLIHLYSTGYMAEDESRHRFFSYLNLFMFSMLILVLAGNMLVLFVGWEGVGLCSYLLIGFWFKNLNYAAAGRKAFVVNRIGDAGFLLGIFLLWVNYGTLDFQALSNTIAASPSGPEFFNLVALCLFVGAAGKSAQIPLFVWLPDAMAGPTPVSALIHAATMVTAGVYLMARMHFIFDLAPYTMLVVTWVALVTAFVAATTALAQNDIKKVLAYSTVSQLGFMFMAASAGAYWVAIFHVVTHAFFKACLFLGAGSVIHGCHHEQDMRKMGGLLKLMPITAVTYLVSTLAIAGIAPFAGYYSKHAIIAALEGNPNPMVTPALTGFFVALANVTALCTAFYMTRSFAMTFLGTYRGGHDTHHHDAHHDHHGHGTPHESPFSMTIPLIILAALALIGGYGLEYVTHLAHYLSPVLPVGHELHGESFVESIFHSWIGIVGVLAGLLCYTLMPQIPALVSRGVSPLTQLFAGKYYFDEIYRFAIVRPLEGMSRFLWKGVDQSVIDGAVNATGTVVEVTGEAARLVHTGQIRHYALFMFLATVVVIVFYMAL